MPKFLRLLLPIRPETGLRVHGTINIAVGSFLLIKPSRRTSLLAAGWWVSVLPLCAKEEGWPTGLRDACIVMALLSADTNQRS